MNSFGHLLIVIELMVIGYFQNGTSKNCAINNSLTNNLITK